MMYLFLSFSSVQVLSTVTYKSEVIAIYGLISWKMFTSPALFQHKGGAYERSCCTATCWSYWVIITLVV